MGSPLQDLIEQFDKASAEIRKSRQAFLSRHGIVEKSERTGPRIFEGATLEQTHYPAPGSYTGVSKTRGPRLAEQEVERLLPSRGARKRRGGRLL